MVKLLLSFKSVYNFGNYLAITPPYDFRKQNLTNGNLFKCYLIIFGIASTVGEIWSLHWRSDAIKNLRTSIKVCDFINEISLFGTYMAIKIFPCFVKTKNWKNLFSLMGYLSKYLKNKPDKKSIVYFATGQIIIGHLLFCLLTTYQWMALCSTDLINFDLLATYVIHYLSYYNILYVVIVMNTILFMFEKKFKMLNNDFEQQFMATQKFTSLNPKCIGIIKQTGFLLEKLNTGIDIFNDLFGNVIILKLINMVINVTVMINVCFLSNALGKYSDKTSINDKNIMIASTMSTCFALSWTVLFVLLCQRITDEVKKTVQMCYAFQSQVYVKSDEREELLKLATMAAHKIPVFSAGGYLEINKGTLTSIFSSVTTYVIVLIQLNMSMY